MKIYGAINAIMKDIGAISKSQKNAQQGYMYRGIDAVMNALQPLMIKNGVFCVPEVLEHAREERATKGGGSLIYSVCKVRYSFYADDGSSVAATVIGEGMDSGDKSSNKALAVALKYACFQIFCIPTEGEMRDPDADSPEVGPKTAPEIYKGNLGAAEGRVTQGSAGAGQGVLGKTDIPAAIAKAKTQAAAAAEKQAEMTCAADAVVDAGAVISKTQAKRIVEICGLRGMDAEKCKAILAKFGYAKTTDVRKADFIAVCMAIRNAA